MILLFHLHVMLYSIVMKLFSHSRDTRSNLFGEPTDLRKEDIGNFFNAMWM